MKVAGLIHLLKSQTRLSLSHEYYGKSHMFQMTVFFFLFSLMVYLLCLHLRKCTMCTIHIASYVLRSDNGIGSPGIDVIDACGHHTGAEN